MPVEDEAARPPSRGSPSRARTPLAELSNSGATPARLGLSKALQAGEMRNPLGMKQTAWHDNVQVRGRSAGRDWGSDAGGGGGGGGGSRPGSAVDGPRRPASRSSSRPGSRPGSRLGSRPGSRGRGFGSSSGSAALPKAGALEPQRIELPAYLNTPPRRPDKVPATPEERIQIGRRITDLELLTFACRRANKVREEGRAHFSLGVLHDNLAAYEKAIKAYASFLKVCKECNDLQGAALAYHCLGVDYQLLGSTNGGKAGGPGGASAGGGRQVADGQLRKALYFHNKHRESSDSVGKFVAHLNMGITYSELGEREASTVNHQYALRYALQLHSLEGQSLAIGNLGFSAGMYENDPEKMRILIERYVELCDSLRQGQAQTGAFQKLGALAVQQGDYQQSHSYFQEALALARSEGDLSAEKHCQVQLGIAVGRAKMDEHMNQILENSIKGLGRSNLGESALGVY